MTLAELIPSLLNSLVDNRVWMNATPDQLPRDAGGIILPFIIWHQVGGQDQEFLEGTMPSHRHARIQVQCCAPSGITAGELDEAVVQAFLTASDVPGAPYTVGVLGSPVGAYDADRKLQAPWRQFSVWFRP